jgi:Cys-rich repeat protein
MRTFILAAALTLLALPARAADVACTTDADCGEGQVCVLAPCAMPAIDCAPDQSCPDPMPCVSTGTCAAEPWDGRCAADADCPAGFACIEVQIPCATASCAPCACACEAGAECPPCECPPCDTDVACEPTVEQYCQYQPKACKADADCGAGWACRAEELCSGGAGCACPPCVSGAECPACECDLTPTEPECEVVGQWCAPAETACTADGDCPADFACVSRTNGTDCACPSCACDPSAAPDCTCEPCTCPEPVQESVCLPRGWSDMGYGGPDSLPEPGTVAGDGAEKGTPVSDYTTAPGGAAGTGGPSGPGAPPRASGPAGCDATGRPSSPAWMGLLLILGLVPFARRRPVR